MEMSATLIKIYNQNLN